MDVREVSSESGKWTERAQNRIHLWTSGISGLEPSGSVYKIQTVCADHAVTCRICRGP